MRYRVTWEIDVEADNPEAAAHAARGIQQDPANECTCFTVLWFDDENCGQVDVDICPTVGISEIPSAS